MSEQTMNNAPMGVPDILMNAPLTRQVDVTLETNILDPVSHSFNSASGGRTVFQLPPKGVLDSQHAAIVFEAAVAGGRPSGSLAYTAWAGGLGAIRRITARCGGNILSQIENVGTYGAIKSNFKSQAVKENILDIRHHSSSGLELRVAPAQLFAGSPSLTYQQLYNPELDQCSTFGGSYNGGNDNTHQIQVSKCLTDTIGTGPEVVVRLADIFELFNSHKLPLLAMALVEIEIEWNAFGDATTQADPTSIQDSPVIDSLIPNAAVNAVGARTEGGEVVLSTPTMLLDYIHYDDQERQKIFDSVNSGGGLRLDFSEVLLTKGVNPAGPANGGADVANQVQSNHIIGMAMKEVKKIYVVKNFDLNTTIGTAERDADTNQMKTHRNIVLNQFKSQQMLGESYNFFINNQRVYDNDVSNPSVQMNYLTQCKGKWTCPGFSQNTENYNENYNAISLNSSWSGLNRTDNINSGATHRYLSGVNHVIGLNLDSYNSLGSAPGNGTRIGSSPIEFNYSRVAVDLAAGAAGSSRAEVNLDFFIVYRRSLIVRSLGIDVSDS